MKLGDLVRYYPKSWAMPEQLLRVGLLGVVADKSGYLWGVQWLGVEVLHYHLQADLEITNENR
jgi:hypothetical protein